MESAPQSRLYVEQEIRDVVEGGGVALGLPDTVSRDSAWKQLGALYAQRRHRPIWSDGKRPHPRSIRLLETIGRVADAGLDPADYSLDRLLRLRRQAGLDRPLARELRPRTLARFDVLATYAFQRLSRELRKGRVPPEALDPDWVGEPGKGAEVFRLAEQVVRDPAGALAGREPRHAGYRRLRAALARYREIAARGGWPQIRPGPPLQLGSRGPRVAALVRRLAMTGDFGGPMADTVFDRRLERAVGDLQARFGIPRSGILGEATRVVLNVPVEERIREMELNLERWRWLPDTLGARRVEVNIPAYRLELIDRDTVRRAMRVVVGRRKSPTPVFSDRITYLEVNPTWTLPKSVVVKEIVPALRRDPRYLDKNRMHVISISRSIRDTIPHPIVPWKRADSDTFPYLVVQSAGPDNPLGSIKLMCPNEYDVYLHDTPQRSRFSLAARDYSHGCVRVEHATELADSLLARAPGDTVRLDTLIARGTWRRIRLRNPVPVHFMYWTAWVDEAGRLHHREDLYGLDRRLDEALRARDTRSFVLNPDVEISPFWAAAEARAREASVKVAAARGAAKRR